MTDSTQPEALRLAELLELAPEDGVEPQTAEDAAAELRRQHARIAELEAKLEAIGAGGVAPLIGQQTRDSFTAADMATAAEEGYRDGAAETAKLRGQRMVLCSLLGECRGHLEDAAHAMHMVEEEMPVWDLVERIESALKAISEDQVKGGES